MTPPTRGTESTPLLLSKVNQAVSNCFTEENMSRAQNVASARAGELRESFATGDFSLRLLVLLGGVAVVITALIGLLVDFWTFNMAQALVEIYTLALGCIILVLESKQLSLPPAMLQKLLKYALFLRFIWGRGLLYTFAGTLQATQGTILDQIVGVYLMTVGIIFIVLGYLTAQKLATVGHNGRSSFSTNTLRTKFNAVDTGKKGRIDFAQFCELIDSLDMAPLNRREKEVAFLYLNGGEGTLSFDEFEAWFKPDEETAIL